MNRILFFSIFISSFSLGQSFAPAPGNPGSTAIYKDSSIIIDWATNVTVTRGPRNILNPSAGLASYGTDSNAIGNSSGTVVSLGDGGEAIATFDSPIVNGPGPDFTIFENGFADDYLELAFVEVSSDGFNYFRFPATSEIPTNVQSDNFTFTDCRYVNNLAGKYRVYFGTPFDLQELIGIPGLDVGNITHVKIIDVIGSIDPAIGSFDSQGTIINEPFPTEFETGGFDLTAIGVIHSTTESIEELDNNLVKVYPNPSNGIVHLESDFMLDYSIVDAQGRVILRGLISGSKTLELTGFDKGIYFVKVNNGLNVETIKLEVI
ncbi:MAG: T9SS type A sorting domain-containing protein [Crocinitomicaceae bacterium]|nr:T9SS type A sorting domain-containing protein [Crocinitomicaceae bacterium]